jgi:hypothetical protein
LSLKNPQMIALRAPSDSVIPARGTPLTSHLPVVELIASTTTKTGLKVRCELDTRTYPKGIKVSEQEMASLV